MLVGSAFRGQMGKPLPCAWVLKSSLTLAYSHAYMSSGFHGQNHLRVCHIQDCPLWGMLSSGYTQNKNYYISYVSIKKKWSCWLNWVMWLGSPLFLGWVGYLPAPGSAVPTTDLRGRSQREWPAVSPRLLVMIASTTPRSLASRIDSILMDIVAYTLLIIFLYTGNFVAWLYD